MNTQFENGRIVVTDIRGVADSAMSKPEFSGMSAEEIVDYIVDMLAITLRESPKVERIVVRPGHKGPTFTYTFKQ